MPLTELNHYFIRANELEKTKDFYCDVLGFQVMPRPTFPFPGYWLGVNGKIQVHMGPDGIENADMFYLGTPKNAVTDHAGVVDHIAFLATEPGTLSGASRSVGSTSSRARCRSSTSTRSSSRTRTGSRSSSTSSG
jgi:catechol 2,3-dioxygenase-like lactoylglutathione lyase family enzyme